MADFNPPCELFDWPCWYYCITAAIAILVIILIRVLVKSQRNKHDKQSAILYKKFYHKILPSVDLRHSKRISFTILSRAIEFYLKKHSTLTDSQKEEIHANCASGLIFLPLTSLNADNQSITRRVCVRTYPLQHGATPAALDEHLQRIYTMCFNHPNLCKTIAGFLHRDGKGEVIIYLVEEFVDGPVLDELIADLQRRKEAPRLSAERVATFTKQMLKGLSYLHLQGWAHNGVRAKRVVIRSDDSLKLIGMLECAPLPASGKGAQGEKDIEDLRRLLQVISDVTEKKGVVKLQQFIKALNGQTSSASLLEHEFIKNACKYGPRKMN